MRVVNYQRWPLTLEDGTILAAAGTNGSTKEVVSLSDRDHRHVNAGRIAIVIEEEPTIAWIARKPEDEATSNTEEKPLAAAPLREVSSDETPIGSIDTRKPETQKPETKPRTSTRGGRTNA